MAMLSSAKEGEERNDEKCQQQLEHATRSSCALRARKATKRGRRVATDIGEVAAWYRYRCYCSSTETTLSLPL
jgi:hypothetical protein